MALNIKVNQWWKEHSEKSCMLSLWWTVEQWLNRYMLFFRKVMDQCENFKEDPMETNPAQEVNYGQRGWHCRSHDSQQAPSEPTEGLPFWHHHQGQLCALFLSSPFFFFCRAELSLTLLTAVLIKKIWHIRLKMWCMVCFEGAYLCCTEASLMLGLWGWVTAITQCECVRFNDRTKQLEWLLIRSGRKQKLPPRLTALTVSLNKSLTAV